MEGQPTADRAWTTTTGYNTSNQPGDELKEYMKLWEAIHHTTKFVSLNEEVEDTTRRRWTMDGEYTTSTSIVNIVCIILILLRALRPFEGSTLRTIERRGE